MVFQRSTVRSIAAVAAGLVVALATASADAKDWKRAMDRHDEAAKLSKFTPRGGNPQWDFDLETVVNDMAWRERTARTLRELRRPGVAPHDQDQSQIANRPAPPRPRFSF